MLRKVFLSFGLLAAAAGATLAEPPDLSEIRYLPGDAEIGPAAGDQHKVDVAPGGNQSLAVWVDQRTDLVGILDFGSGPYDALDLGSMWDIYAARLDAQGEVIDATPIPVSQQTFNQSFPDVAYNGQDWLVVWQGQAVADAFGNRRINIYAARVSADGVLLDDPPIVVDEAETMDGLRYPEVASDGENWFVVWFDLDPDAGIFQIDGARIAPDGTVLDPGGVPVRHPPNNTYPTPWDIAFLSDRYLVTFGEGTTVYGQFVAPDTALLDGPFRISQFGRPNGSAQVATDGQQFFVVYTDANYPGYRQVWASRVQLDGTVQVGPEVTPRSGFGCYAPSVAFDGTNFVVGYERGLFPVHLHAAIVTPAGQVLQNEIVVSDEAEHSDYSAAVGLPGGGSALLWQDDRNGGFGRRDIMGATIAGEGTVGPQRYIALGAPRQTEPDAADTGDGHMIVYLSDRSVDVRVLAQRVGLDGSTLDPEPVVVMTGGAEIRGPAVGWDGSMYLVVWENADQNRIYGKRISAEGVLVDDEPIDLLAGNTPDAAGSDGLFLVVASEEALHEIRYPMAIRFRGSDGTILDSPIQLGGNFSILPRADGFENGGWAVTWERRPTHDNPTPFTHGAIVDLDGTFGASFELTDGTGSLPDVAAAADTAAFFYTKGSADPGRHNIVYKRVLRDRTHLDATDQVLNDEYNRQRRPAAAWDGTRFFVEWVDDRNDDLYEQARGDLYAARLTADGTVVDPDGFAVANDSLPETQAFVTARSGATLLGGSLFRLETDSAIHRIGYRVTGRVPAAIGDPAAAAALRLQVFPNPAGALSTIRLRMPEEGPVRIAVYDVAGRMIRSLHDGNLSGGETQVRWDGRDGAGRAVAPGLYFLRADVEHRSLTKKLLRR